MSKPRIRGILDYVLPGTDVARGDDCLPWSSEEARQVVPLVSARLHVVAELHHNDVGHHVTVL
jgi:hypothetical protein